MCVCSPQNGPDKNPAPTTTERGQESCAQQGESKAGSEVGLEPRLYFGAAGFLIPRLGRRQLSFTSPLVYLPSPNRPSSALCVLWIFGGETTVLYISHRKKNVFIWTSRQSLHKVSGIFRTPETCSQNLWRPLAKTLRNQRIRVQTLVWKTVVFQSRLIPDKLCDFRSAPDRLCSPFFLL